MLKAPFLLYIFTFLPGRFGYAENQVDKKVMVIVSKFMKSQTAQQIFAMYMLPNISRCKSKQAMKFG